MAVTLRLATPEQVPAGYWDRCVYCGKPVFLPIAGSKDAKAPVRCPHCRNTLLTEC